MVVCEAPVQGIVGAYTGNSFAVQASIASLLACALYSALELIILVFSTFKKYHGLYFWSLLVARTASQILRARAHLDSRHAIDGRMVYYGDWTVTGALFTSSPSSF